MAQASSVTISGMFKVGFENTSYSNASTTRLNSSQMRVVDNSSRIIFTSVEDLGNGLSAIGNLDVRFAPDQASGTQTSNPIGSGNTYVGLKSTNWGMLTMGRWDLHYGKGPSENTRGAGALLSSDVSVFDYIGSTPIANTSRTQNVVKYDSPVWSGFSGTIAYSSNPVGNSEADMSTTNGPGVVTRKGDGWNLNPRFVSGPFQIEYSYWKAKPDAVVAATADQRGDSLTGKFQMGGLQIGLGFNKSRLDNSTTGVKIAERNVWALAGNYKWGPHAVFAHYDRAGSISSQTVGVNTASTGAKMFAATYEYSLSKRTSLAATYAKIDNEANINYNFFTSSSLGSQDATVLNGEKPRLLQATILHLF
jgi:predicted porin